MVHFTFLGECNDMLGHQGSNMALLKVHIIRFNLVN